MRGILLAVGILLLGSSFVLAQGELDDPTILEDQLKQNPDQPELLLKLGRIYHDSGARGDEEAVKKAVGYLEKLLELSPNLPEARCWYGSVLTMKARDVWFPLTKANFVN